MERRVGLNKKEILTVRTSAWTGADHMAREAGMILLVPRASVNLNCRMDDIEFRRDK